MSNPKFADFVATYLNKKNPATQKIWKTDDIKVACGFSDSLFNEWYGIYLSVNGKSLEDEGFPASDQQLIDAYKAIHGEDVVIDTPFGVIYKKEGSASDKMVRDCSVAELVSDLVAAIKAAQ
jgi:hypothetical protein